MTRINSLIHQRCTGLPSVVLWGRRDEKTALDIGRKSTKRTLYVYPRSAIHCHVATPYICTFVYAVKGKTGNANNNGFLVLLPFFIDCFTASNQQARLFANAGPWH